MKPLSKMRFYVTDDVITSNSPFILGIIRVGELAVNVTLHLSPSEYQNHFLKSGEVHILKLFIFMVEKIAF